VKPLNAAVSSCPPSGIRKFFDIAASMRDVISLGVGEPDFVTPWRAREAGIYGLEHGYTTYTSNAGLLELREAVCLDLSRRYGAEYDAATECIVTAGVSEGLDVALRVLLEPGDEVIVPEPCYVAYGPCVTFAGGKAVYVPADGDTGFRLDPGRIESAVTARTKAILIASPANPTGAVQTAADLAAVVEIANKHDLYLVSDEIYARLSYERPHTCVASLPGARERTVLLGGFSKSHAMTGWRVGYLCAPVPILELVYRIHQYTLLCAPHVSQLAALEAIDACEDEVLDMVADYDRRRRFFVKGLREIGLECAEPGGAFYTFPSIRVTGLDDEEFAEQLLLRHQVAVVPGSVFGPSGRGHIRCCYATALPLLEESLDRMGKFVDSMR
jgi:aminotransferase